jgi:hypothetical protein
MIRRFIQQNIPLTAIAIFMIVFITTQIMKPDIFYNLDGGIRLFGVGYRNKTIMPVWLLSIFMGILSYVAVLFYTTYS